MGELMNYQVYSIYDGEKNKNGEIEHLFNVAVFDILGVFRYCKDNNFIWKFLDIFELREDEIDCLIDDENVCEDYGIVKVINQKMI